jgi:cytidylate kinase
MEKFMIMTEQGLKDAIGVKSIKDIASETSLNYRTIAKAAHDLGYTRNGVKCLLTVEQQNAIYTKLGINTIHNTNRYSDKDLAIKLQGDPLLRLAALYAEIDEIKKARIQELETKVSELTALADARERGLSQIQIICEDAGLLLTDRDDIDNTYNTFGRKYGKKR